MTHESSPTPAPTAPSAPLYRLKTFGTLALQGPGDDTVLGKHGHHRRRLALLAVLAAAGDHGRSRDHLLLFFWPEATQTRARHSLDQLLYALRGSIGDSLFETANPVRLNPSLVSSDVADFVAARERDDLEAAVQAYGGPFLDGFYIEDAPEFERWVEEERARLLGSYATALESLAQRAEAAQNHATAVRWWRKLVETDPVSSRNATGLIRSLMNAGDHAAALQYAERYESLVAQELGTSVGPAVAALVAEVRAETRTERIAPSKATAPAPAAKTPAATAPNESEPSEVKPSRSALRRPVVYAIAALGLVIAVTATAWLRGNGRANTKPDADASSIAVLPLANVSGDPQDAAIVDGLSEELITALWKIANLRVIARTSSFAFKKSELDVRRIGDSLGVANILESSFQKIASRVRVQVRLVDARSGAARWSETYDRELKDIFAVESDIAAEVARELNLRLGAGAAQQLRRGLTKNIAAYELYLRGRDPIHLRTDSGPAIGLALLQQAVALDSNFAAAYAMMPYRYFGLAGRAPDMKSAREIRQLALGAARKALAIDSTLPEAYAGLGVALAMGLSDLRGSEAAHRRSLELGGSPRVREHLSRVLMWTGRHAEALTEAVRAAAEDPLSPSAAADVGEALCVNRRYAEGLAQLQRVASVRPPLQRVAGYTGLCYAMQGMWPEAIAALGHGGSSDPWSPLYGYAVARSGDVAKARRMQAATIERWQRTGRGAANVAQIAAGLGDYDQVFEWLDRTQDDLGSWSSFMYPLFEDLHVDPRFQRFRERLGIQKR